MTPTVSICLPSKKLTFAQAERSQKKEKRLFFAKSKKSNICLAGGALFTTEKSFFPTFWTDVEEKKIGAILKTLVKLSEDVKKTHFYSS